MALSEEQRSKVAAWIRQKAVGTTCTACGEDSWEYRDLLHHEALPAVALVCTNCGHAVLFDGRRIGLL